MSSDYLGYMWEKFMAAVLGMAESPGSIQHRIADAYSSQLMRLEPDRFVGEPNWRWRFEDISRELTSGTPVGDEGTIQASVASMSDEEATKIAREIVSLYDEISAHYRELEIQESLKAKPPS